MLERREAELLMMLDHPGIVECYDVVDDGHQMVIIMVDPAAPGCSLSWLVPVLEHHGLAWPGCRIWECAISSMRRGASLGVTARAATPAM